MINVLLIIKTLQTHNKFENICTLVIGDIVVIKEENKSRMLWRKGLVTELIKGKHNLIRGAEPLSTFT